MSALASIATAAAQVPPATAIEVDPFVWQQGRDELANSFVVRHVTRGQSIVGRINGREGYALIGRLILKGRRK